MCESPLGCANGVQRWALADIFVSYTSSDREWAYWIAQELEKLDHTPHVHEWEISPGGNIVDWMEKRLDDADQVLCVISAAYLKKDYSSWERQSGQWAAISKRTNFVLPVFIEDCEPPKLLAPFKRCELYGLGEEEARTQLTDYLKSGVRPQGLMRFPGGTKVAASTPDLGMAVAFPGVRQPRNLPLASLGDLFKGREKALEELRAVLMGAGERAAVVGRALHGLGGIGKTRLAIEYAWAHEADYSALLFVRAENAATLNANLAALAGASVINLAEKEEREDATKIEAVLRWLEANPTWLLILDNVDDPEAVKAVVELMPRLKGGHAILTARAANFPATIRKLELDTLDVEPATQFLLERTADDRLRANDDEAQAHILARELGGLALGLEQAGAQIAADRIGFARYLKLWNDSREKLFAWSNPILTGYEKTLATTWATSVARLSPESRRLLDLLAMLAPDPIPGSLLEVAVPGEMADYDAHRACGGLFAYSLIARAKGEDGEGFVIHILVQDFARRAMSEERRTEALGESLNWLSAAFADDTEDVRSWPILDALVPHALAIARRAGEAGIAEPTGWILHQLGLLFYTKARYAEAEPLMRHAIEINALHPAPDVAKVASGFGNLALLLVETNRPDEAEPLLQRALALDEFGIWPGSLESGHSPEQSRGIASRDQPCRRGRFADTPRASD